MPTKILPQHPESVNTINCKIILLDVKYTATHLLTWPSHRMDCSYVQQATKLKERKVCRYSKKVPRSVHATLTLLFKTTLKETTFDTQMPNETYSHRGAKLLLLLPAYNYFNNFRDILAIQCKN